MTFIVDSGPALTLLQTFYDGHEPTQDWASFRFNLDHLFVDSEANPLGGLGINRYYVDPDVETSSFKITAIPEPSTAGLLAVFAGAALLRRRLRR